MSLALRARSLPYRPAQTNTHRICARCGIQFRNHQPKRDGYHTKCRDCREDS